ncbi:unnamed protein product [Durusdinium trenchii]|uniref:Uncharacterized protein n=1 Tax=Durusdinium trenchii TaxID=1381693 RepID=A0ABP0MFV8_9DINO
MDEPLLGGSAIEQPAEPRGRPQTESVDSSKEYELNSFEAFRRYCINANIALVRPEFLEELCQEGRVWPRRQEAEHIPGALYKPGPDDEFSFIGISHCWEAREHPDPFGYQLKTIVGAWHYWQEVDPEVYRDDNTYFFIDYMSLPQFKRSAEEQTCFQCAMRHMHLFYANSSAFFCKSVWRLEDLTPAGVKRQQIRSGRTIPVYILAEGKVVEVPLKRLKRSIGGKCSSSCDENCRNLHANDIVYLGRGWCRAEFEWAKPYTVDISRRGVCLRRCSAEYDALFHRLSLPWTPEAFQRSVATRALKFTHRGDIDPVLELQRTVFQQKVATLENFRCAWLPCHEVHDLVELVPLLQAVQFFQLVAAHVADSQQMALATALGTRQTLQTVAINCIQLSPGAAQVLAAVPRLHTLGLIDCGLGDAGAGAVANALAQHPTLREVQLQINAIGSRGATALAKALVTNNVLEKLNLQYNKIRSRGAVALAEALRSNDTLRCLMFRFNPIGAQGVRALRRIAERIAVAHEGLERNADASWCGWMCCILIRVFWWICFIMIVLPMRCFSWRQRAIACISARGKPAQPEKMKKPVDVEEPDAISCRVEPKSPNEAEEIRECRLAL